MARRQLDVEVGVLGEVWAGTHTGDSPRGLPKGSMWLENEPRQSTLQVKLRGAAGSRRGGRRAPSRLSLKEGAVCCADGHGGRRKSPGDLGRKGTGKGSGRWWVREKGR